MSAFPVLNVTQIEVLLLQAERLSTLSTDNIKLHSAVIVVRDQTGKIVVRELTAEEIAATAVGTFITAGLPLGPGAAMIGQACRALIPTERIDHEEEPLVAAIIRELNPGEAKIVAMLDESDLAMLEPMIKRAGGKVIRIEQNGFGRSEDQP